ncbi:uncharacterized protein LOC113359847 [Papaver somniferum]|uniref:uncharacterized protein LOC113359847 n=1 Tax=Papaver somniferum TaxID=3469 RepID=UPI000E6F6A54|nr:uncharacterized protein LOC113359847 [Papaver somniferum]
MDIISLEKEFSEEEVKNVMDHFGVNKSTGPDGFAMEFYKHAWEGRQIHDTVLIASEIIDSIVRSQETGLICKVDFEKAFDNVNWGCVDITLDRFEFGHKWRSCIKWCVTTPRFVVFLKGEATNLFRSQKGIRQGDPISPFLFILVVGVLSLMFKSAADQGLISGFKVAAQVTVITQLKFSNDHIVFLEDNEMQMHNGEICAKIFECSSSQLPLNYLGIQLGRKSCCRLLWNEVVQKFQQKSIRTIGRSLWIGILKTRDLTKYGTSLIIRNGAGIYFWEDIWVGEQTLKQIFPSLFKISKGKKLTVKEMVSDQGAWNLQFVRTLNELELQEVIQLLQVIGDPNAILSAASDDRHRRYGD